MVQGFTSIGHVAIRTKDLDASLDFYCNKLGLKEIMRLHRDNGDLWLIYLRLTDDQYIEVFPDAVGDRAPPREAIGLNHMCITVDDVESVVAQLDKAGVPLFQPLKMGGDGNRQAWIQDPDGNRIELMEMSPTGMQAEAIRRLKQGMAHA